MSAKSPSAFTRTAGFTLVEIMIGMLIGLVGIVVIMQVFAVSEGYRRTSTSGTDAQVNGGIAMYLMQRELRIAGYGLTPLMQQGCQGIVVWNNSTGKSSMVGWQPIQINPAGIPPGDGNTDVLLIVYGNADSFVSGIPVNQLTTNVDDFAITSNKDGFHTGDLVVGVQPGGGPGGTTSCVMHELTGVPSTAGNCAQGAPANNQLVLYHRTAGYKSANALCANTTPTHNSSTGILDPSNTPTPRLDQSKGALLFNMGGAPNSKIYAIHGGNLTSCNTVSADCTNVANYEVMVNDIVSMHAIIGGDYNGAPPAGSSALGDGSVDRWSRASIATQNDILRTLAVAIELTARSTLKEKQVAGVCVATTSAEFPDNAITQDWYQPFTSMASGSLAGAKVDLSIVGADWGCYRYRQFHTVVPLRNLVWRP